MMRFFSKLLVVLVIMGLVFMAGCSNSEKAMVNAVKNGDAAKVQNLLEKGVSPNLKTEDGKTILMLATYLGHADVAELLIERGADVNARDNEGKTALMYAAEKGNIEMAKLLLEKGADLNIVDNNGKTALQIAENNNQAAMVEFLNNWGKQDVASDPEEITTPEPVISEETSAPTPVVTTTPESELNLNQQLSSIYFDLNKYLLRSDQNEVMEANIAQLRANTSKYIILSGHADERGSRQYNLDLSEKRTEIVKEFLLDKGFDAAKIIVYAFGKDFPLKKDHNEASWGQNRRVDILVWDTVLTKEQVITETIR